MRTPRPLLIALDLASPTPLVSKQQVPSSRMDPAETGDASGRCSILAGQAALSRPNRFPPGRRGTGRVRGAGRRSGRPVFLHGCGRGRGRGRVGGGPADISPSLCVGGAAARNLWCRFVLTLLSLSPASGCHGRGANAAESFCGEALLAGSPEEVDPGRARRNLDTCADSGQGIPN